MIVTKTASFLYEFLGEVGRNNSTNITCSCGDKYITPLYCIGRSSQYNMWPVVTGSYTHADACILCYTLDEHAYGTRVWPCYNSSHVVSWLTSNSTVEIFKVIPYKIMESDIKDVEFSYSKSVSQEKRSQELTNKTHPELLHLIHENPYKVVEFYNWWIKAFPKNFRTVTSPEPTPEQ